MFNNFPKTLSYFRDTLKKIICTINRKSKMFFKKEDSGEKGKKNVF